MQKNAISYYEYVEYACKCKKNMLMISKKTINKQMQNMQKMQKNATSSVCNAVFGGYHPV